MAENPNIVAITGAMKKFVLIRNIYTFFVRILSTISLRKYLINPCIGHAAASPSAQLMKLNALHLVQF